MLYHIDDDLELHSVGEGLNEHCRCVDVPDYVVALYFRLLDEQRNSRLIGSACLVDMLDNFGRARESVCNERATNDAGRFLTCLQMVVGKRLTWRLLTAQDDAGFMGIA